MAAQTMGRLPEAIKAKLVKNTREMALAEGNLLSAGKGARSLFVTSSFKGEGKTTAALSLAYGLTINGSATVLLVDGNPTAPLLHQLFQVETAPGFTEFLQGGVQLADLIRGTDVRNLAVMPFGSSGLEISHILKANLLQERLTQLQEHFDYIIMDGGPVMSSSEVNVLAGQFDGVVLVVECEKTKWEVVQSAVERLRLVNGKVLGVVLNKRRYYIPAALYGKI
ncbi:CpsD/CapB family tyrosine-protein kinase [Megalodesulfovibrio gigas]|uniref:non-specific protein-tyrosine kinase n=1 Tax=Megalodesulfovibrio gigas (strain ATCC 19364 / DSM 1382 / NCIMB 9332 / VKM B-1759) TaxID=1121448 RepID=T2GC90_MEGG1|nr:CpsD/CapB family tyrosine-protein kinase [Megalodesulfovibrio gigas]AGW13736.1 putative ATPase [Megalodesulfovibrio gigas DSM 1382 = ATCC 19364]